MKKKTVRYTDDKGEIVGDLRPLRKGELPSLDQLVGKLHQRQKVTIALDGEAISCFKREASKRHTSYQRMIRNLVIQIAICDCGAVNLRFQQTDLHTQLSYFRISFSSV